MGLEIKGEYKGDSMPIGEIQTPWDAIELEIVNMSFSCDITITRAQAEQIVEYLTKQLKRT